MKLGFCGSGFFAAECLKHITQYIKPQWVITNTPQKAGRSLKLCVTPVQKTAEKLDIPFKTTNVISEDNKLINWIDENSPDVILVIDFGQMIKEPLLSLPKFGCLNIHPSKLPSYRGSSPLQRAIVDGLKTTAVTVFKLDEGMDTGPILVQKEMEISIKDDYYSLLKKSSLLGSHALIEHIIKITPEHWIFTKQSENDISFAPKIKKSEGILYWDEKASFLYNKIRAFKHFPGTFCFIDGKRLAIKEAEIVKKSGPSSSIIGFESGMPIVACLEDALKLITVQQEGKREQKASEWVRGSRMQIGDKFN